MLTVAQREALEDATVDALICERTTGVPYQLTVAQWALESGWGQHCPGRNCFGIKSLSSSHPRQLLPTTEWFTPQEMHDWLSRVAGRSAQQDPNMPANRQGQHFCHCSDWFVVFPTQQAGFEAHAHLFRTDKYALLFSVFQADQKLDDLIEGIAPIYATDPAYAGKLKAILKMSEVKRAMEAVRFGGPDLT